MLSFELFSFRFSLKETLALLTQYTAQRKMISEMMLRYLPCNGIRKGREIFNSLNFVSNFAYDGVSKHIIPYVYNV